MVRAHLRMFLGLRQKGDPGSTHVSVHIKGVAKRLRREPRPCLVRSGALVLVLLILLLPARGWAAAYGSVSGIVHDETGKAVAEAEGGARIGCSRNHGAADRLRPGPLTPGGDRRYTLTVSQRDFASRGQPITVEAGYFPFAAIALLRSSQLAEVTVTAARLAPVASITYVDREPGGHREHPGSDQRQQFRNDHRLRTRGLPGR